jgi:hypothetical protein
MPFNQLSLFIIYFSVFSLPLQVVGRGVLSVAENQSIKNNKLCETNPISGTPKMNLTHYSTNRYDNNSGLLTMQKRSQTNPILSASGGLVRRLVRRSLGGDGSLGDGGFKRNLAKLGYHE